MTPIGHERRLVPLCTIAVLGILALDWITPAGVVVGILLSVPIVASSLASRVRDIWTVSGVAAGGFVIAALFGQGPVSPPAVWGPNRVFVIFALAASVVIALRLQDRRLRLEAARDAALRASDTSRLLRSLLAHDLRSPLATALYALGYARTASGEGESIDVELLRDAEHRLRRNVARLDGILDLVRDEMVTTARSAPGGSPDPHDASDARSSRIPLTGSELARELRVELEGFGAEARALDKPLSLDLEGDDTLYLSEPVVVRQAASILVDNAIRHAGPGPISVTGRAGTGELRLTVSNAGPAVGGNGERPGRGLPGSGLGLELCRALVSRFGGSLERIPRATDGTEFLLRMPLTPAGTVTAHRLSTGRVNGS